MASGPCVSPDSFAETADAAEAGVPQLPRSKTVFSLKPRSTTKEWGTTVQIEDTSPAPGSDTEGPFARHCVDTAIIWKLYMIQAKISDDNLANMFNSDLDPLLIFAGLFSAILAAFLIEIRKGLQEDPQNITNLLLMALIQGQHNASAAQTPTINRFEPSSSTRWLNGLWFSSLMFSLMSALGASLAKGWVTQFCSTISGSNWGDAKQHCSRYRGFGRWHLHLIVQCLPILIHIAFFLFSIGLVVLLFCDDQAIGIFICVLTVLVALLYVGSSIHPAMYPDSPFRTPVSGMIHDVLKGSWRVKAVARFPAQSDAQKAQALTWLLAESQDVETINEAVHAIAGLVAKPRTQDQLLNLPVLDILSRMLSTELAKKSDGTQPLGACLYALLRLVQSAPANAQDAQATDALKALVITGALSTAESIPTEHRAIALCVKWRIILLLCDDKMRDAASFDGDLPVLINSCGDDSHLRRLLIEVQFLARRTSGADKYTYPHDFLAILKDRNTRNRDQVHAELVEAATRGEGLVAGVNSFGVPPLLHGLTTGSNELRKRCVALFSELVTDPSFRRQLGTCSVGREICSLIEWGDVEGRKHVMDVLVALSADVASRDVIITGLPAILERLPHSQPQVMSDIITFVAGVASYDGVRGIIRESHIEYFVTSMGKLEDKNSFDRAVKDILRLASYDDMQWGLTRAMSGLMEFEPCRKSFRLRAIVAFLREKDSRAVVSRAETIQKVLGMLGDFEWDVRHSAMEALSAFLEHDDSRAVLSRSETIHKVIDMLSHSEKNVRRAALDTLTAFMNHDDLRALVSTPPTIQKIAALLNDSNSELRQMAEVTLMAFLRHDDSRFLVSNPEMIHKLTAMLGDSNRHVQQSALDIFEAYLAHDDSRLLVPTTEMIQKLITMLSDSNWDVQSFAVAAFKALLAHANLRTVLSTPETIQKIVATLNRSGRDVRPAALEILNGFLEYDDLRASLSTPYTMQNIVAMLYDSSSGVREAALNTLKVFLEQGPLIRALNSMPETMQTITAMLSGLSHNVRQMARADVSQTPVSTLQIIRMVFILLGHSTSTFRDLALRTLMVFLEHDEMRVLVSTGEMTQQVVRMLRDSDKNVQNVAQATFTAFLKHDLSRVLVATPEIFQGIIDMPITRFQQTMCVTATALLEHDDSRALVLTPEVIRKITARLGDSDASVQMAALVTLTAFLKHVLVATPETFQEIIAMPTTLLQGIVRVTLTALLGHDNSRALVSIPEVIRKITSRLGDSDASVQMVPLVALNVLLEHDDSCQVVSTPEILLKITALLTIPVSDIQLMALDSLQTFMSHDHSRPLVSKAVTIQDITALLDDSSDCVTRKALTTLRSFAGHNDLRGSILTPETIKKIAIFMNTRNMWNPSSLKKALIALESLKLLLEHDDTRASVLKALKIQDIICMLGHSGVPRGMVLDTLRIFLAHTDSRASLSESIQEIFTQLDDFHGENRIVARQTLEGLLQLDDVCALISSTPQLWQAMIGTFTFRDSDVMVILSCSLEYHDFVVAFSTPDSLANMVAMISRSWMDSYFLRFIGRDLIKRHTNIAPICNIIIHEVLQRITHSDASVRRCFIKLILMLPVTYTILSDNLTQLLLVLANMDSAIVGNAAEMIIHFTANDQFRASFAQMNIWELCLGLLRRHDTAPAALSIVAAFAQYENTRAQIINSHRNIANEFLNMMRAGSTDFQKWSIGVKGLLALGLF